MDQVENPLVQDKPHDVRPCLVPPNGTKVLFQVDMPRRIVVLYSAATRELFATEELYLTEAEAEHDAEKIAGALRKLKIEAITLPADINFVEKLKKINPDLVVNVVDSARGQDYLAAPIAGMLDILGFPYTGTGTLSNSVNYDKYLTKQLLQQAELPVPNFQLFNSYTDPIYVGLRFPLISKLNKIHGAVEITQDAVSTNEKHLRERIKHLIATYKQPVLVEEFIVGREVTAMIVEGVNRKVYCGEKVFKPSDNKFVFATFEDQWLDSGYDSFHYEKYDDPALTQIVKSAFDIVGMRDYGKIDIRLDESGRYYMVDANTNPALGPKESQVAISLISDMYGVTFTDIMKKLITNTLIRCNSDTKYFG
jgi:D-alanine-D-alanine ligase